MKHRVQKLLAQANLGSRRATEELITAGRVRVNGEVAILGTKADPETDVVTLDGDPINIKTVPRYIAYYKPVNVLSSTERQPGDDRPTVRDMVPVEGHFFSVGRLDVESEGLIILTNDGELANELTHPRYEHTKTYQVTVYGNPDGKTLQRWEQGVMLTEEDGTQELTAPCYVEAVRRDGDTALLKVVMTEGRNRQIRRVAALLGHPVKKLVRTHIGRYGLGRLKVGEYADLDADDVRQLTTAAREIEDIQKVKAQARNASQRARFRDLSSASEEQIEEVRRNRPPPAPRPGKKYAERAAHDAERGGRPRRTTRDDSEGRGERSRGPRRDSGYGERGERPRRGGPSDRKPAFRSRLMIDEVGDATSGSRRRRAENETPEGFRSRLSEVDRPQSRPSQGRGPRREGQARDERSDRPSRGPRREGDDRPRRASSGPRREGEGRDDRPRRARPEGERRERPSGEGGDRSSRDPRREGDDRPRRASSGPRREGEGRDDRPRRARPEGERRERPAGEGGERSSRGPRREGDDRPRRTSSGPRREGEGRGPRGGADRGERPSRGPRREAEGRGERAGRPPRNGPRRQSGSEGGETRGERPSRGPRREGGEGRTERTESGERSSRPSGRSGGEQRGRRPAPRPGGKRPSGNGGPRREGGARRPGGQRADTDELRKLRPDDEE